MSRRKATFDPAPAFAALGDRTRLRLVARLSDGVPRSIATFATTPTSHARR